MFVDVNSQSDFQTRFTVSASTTCSVCPSNSNSPAGSAALTSCTCNAGWTNLTAFSYVKGTFRRRSQNDCQEVGSPCWIRSLAAEEAMKAEERAMTTRRSQFPDEMRSADEKLAKPLHGDRLSEVAALLIRSLTVEEDEERAIATRQLQFPQEVRCPNDCSGHGTCSGSQAVRTCQCDVLWTGGDCSTPLCPTSATSKVPYVPSSGHGACTRSADEKLAWPLYGDRLPEVAAKTFVDNTSTAVIARLNKNIRSLEVERIRQVWQKGTLIPLNRRQASIGLPPDTCDGALEAKTLLDRCAV